MFVWLAAKPGATALRHLHITFQYIFLAYLYGNLLGYLLTVISNYIRSEEESANALDQSSVTP